MRDENLVDEHRGLGSLTERIVAAVFGRSHADKEEKAHKLDVSEVEDHRDALRVDVADLEDRMKKELKGLLLLGEHEEVSTRPLNQQKGIRLD